MVFELALIHLYEYKYQTENKFLKFGCPYIRFVNEFGFCDIRHVVKLLDVKKTVAYENIRILIKYGLVMNARVAPTSCMFRMSRR